MTNQTFKVLEADSDGTAYVETLGMSEGGPVVSDVQPVHGGAVIRMDELVTCCWCRPSRVVEEGETLEGCFSFHPRESQRRGHLPTLTIANKN